MISILSSSIAIIFLFYLKFFLSAKDLSIKLLVMNSMNALGACFIAILGVYTQQEFFLDISILYCLVGFVTNAAFLKLRKE